MKIKNHQFFRIQEFFSICSFILFIEKKLNLKISLCEKNEFNIEKEIRRKAHSHAHRYTKRMFKNEM